MVLLFATSAGGQSRSPTRPAQTRPATKPPTQRRLPKGFLSKTVRLPRGEQREYAIFVPPQYQRNPDHHWPLILFLHGAGERGPADGSKLDLVKVHGPPKIVEKDKDFAFIVVSPQCHTDERWDPKQVLALLDHVLKTYPVDPDRVYLTGLSLGGYGTWATAAAAPDRFAAIVPICGGGDPKQACKLKDLPTWAFHGDADKAVPVARSQAMVEAIKKCDENAPVNLTIYPGVGHNSWTQTYENPKLYDWVLSRKRREKK